MRMLIPGLNDSDAIQVSMQVLDQRLPNDHLVSLIGIGPIIADTD